MKLIKFFNYPYPFYENTRQGLSICLAIGVFIASFCYFFEPFGLNKISTLGQLGFGLVSFLVCCFYIVLLPLIFTTTLQTKGWRIYKEILWICTIVLSLAIANFYYSKLFFSMPINGTLVFLYVVFYTALVALIPAVAIILYKQLFVYKKIISDTQKITSKIALKDLVHKELYKTNNQIMLLSENNNDQLKLNIKEFHFLSSAGNYVEVFYVNGNGAQKKLIRNNISKIEKQLNGHNSIIRCHRSHIINLNKIKHASGNLQGYKLQFEEFEEIIPVSRSYTKKLKKSILNI